MPRRSKIQRERDLAIIARMCLQGKNQYEIAEALGLSQQAVSNEIKLLIKRWRESALVDIDQERAIQLARIDELYREYWTAWQRSCRASVERRISGTNIDGLNIDNPDGKQLTTLRQVSRDGNPAFLDGALKCIDRRCKLLGLDAPQQHYHEVHSLSDEELIERARKLFASDSILMPIDNNNEESDYSEREA